MCCDIRVLIAHSFSVTTRNCMLRRENKTNILQARGGVSLQDVSSSAVMNTYQFFFVEVTNILLHNWAKNIADIIRWLGRGQTTSGALRQVMLG